MYKEVVMDYIKEIIKEYMEVISDPGISDHAKVLAKLHAFDDIVEVVQNDYKTNIGFKQLTKERKYFYSLKIKLPTYPAFLNIIKICYYNKQTTI